MIKTDTQSYDLFGLYSSFGEMEDYERWVDDGYEMGKSIGEGKPFELRVSIFGGEVKNLFEVVSKSRVKVDVLIFETEADRQMFLVEEGIKRGGRL